MIYVLLIPFFLQGIFILVDEFYFHQRRTLPKWETIGHPLDTLTTVLCVSWTLLMPYNPLNEKIMIGLCIFSCLFITKDEWIHAKECKAGEMWTHAMLFVLHPIVLFCMGMIWAGPTQYHWILKIQLFLLVIYGIYQAVYWNLFYHAENVNNAFYDDLGDHWYKAKDDPIALLRSESKLFVEWIDSKLKKHFDPNTAHLLDVACGGGLVSNELAKRGWKITAIDLSQESLAIAQKYDTTNSVHYLNMNAEQLHFNEHTFDAVISLDMLEHVENPQKIIAECSRVLKPNGLLFFHTFNRTFLGWLFAVKGIEWVFRNAPAHIHVLRLFIKPSELKIFCKNVNLNVDHVMGVGPKFSRKTWAPLLFKGKVVDEFEFQFTSHTQIGYAGIATKQGNA